MLQLRIIEENPWYKSKDEINKDGKIVDWNKAIAKWDPHLRNRFDFTKDIVYTLRGPRQVGKTTLIKLQIKELLENGISPWNILYYAFDLDTTPKDVMNIIGNYIDNTRKRVDQRFFLFLDEMSSVKNWQKAIKKLWDMNKLQNCTLIITGSNTLDIRTSKEKLPGRRGASNDAIDKILLPMKFSEYVSITDPEFRKQLEQFRYFDHRFKLFNRLLQNEIDDQLYNIYNHFQRLNSNFMSYLLTGGFPKVINEYMNKGFIDENIYTSYLDSIMGDIHSLEISELRFKQLMRNIIKNISWPQTWESLRKETDIGSSATVSRYIDLLHDMFVLTTFYQYDSSKKRPLFEKEKKIHFHDPFYFHVLNSWINPGDSYNLSHSYVENHTTRGSLVEGVIGNHLIRLAFNVSPKKQIFDYTNNIFFWKYGKGLEKEVDYIFCNGDTIEIPIEVKFKNHITSRDIDGIIDFKKNTNVRNSIIVTNDKLDIEREYLAVPACIFLLMV